MLFVFAPSVIFPVISSLIPPWASLGEGDSDSTESMKDSPGGSMQRRTSSRRLQHFRRAGRGNFQFSKVCTGERNVARRAIEKQDKPQLASVAPER